jgi:hypothetical protein
MGLFCKVSLAVKYKSQASLARIPTKNESGKKRTKNMTTQVNRDAIVGFSFRLNSLYTGTKTPVTTMARMITDIKGHRSQPINKQDKVKTARKNHKIKFGEP